MAREDSIGRSLILITKDGSILTRRSQRVSVLPNPNPLKQKHPGLVCWSEQLHDVVFARVQGKDDDPDVSQFDMKQRRCYATRQAPYNLWFISNF